MVFTKVLRRLGVCRSIPVFLLLVSCGSYRTFQVEVLEPSPITVEEGKCLGYWDRNIRYVSDTVSLLGTCPGITPEDLSFLFYTGLKEVILGSGKGDSLISVSNQTPVYLRPGAAVAPVGAEQIGNIGRQFGMDYMVVLEKVGYITDYHTKMAGCDWLIRLYNTATMQVMDSLAYREELTDLLHAEFETADYLRDRAFSLGIDYAYRLVPRWLTVDRRIYTQGKAGRAGDFYLLNQDTKRARELWESETGEFSRRAIGAYINLAWLYENEGNVEAALELLQKALEIARQKKISGNSVRYAHKYREILTKRMQDLQLLNKQL